MVICRSLRTAGSGVAAERLIICLKMNGLSPLRAARVRGLLARQQGRFTEGPLRGARVPGRPRSRAGSRKAAPRRAASRQGRCQNGRAAGRFPPSPSATGRPALPNAGSALREGAVAHGDETSYLGKCATNPRPFREAAPSATPFREVALREAALREAAPREAARPAPFTRPAPP
jgi:hypothetical protein